MINIKNKYFCEHKDCETTPIFNFKNEILSRFCVKHKETGMVDVKHISCKTLDCYQRAYYGFPGGVLQTCLKHRKINMIRNPRKRCIETNCKEIAIYGTSLHEHCELHKLEDEINIIERKCISCGLLGIIDKNNNCETCDPNAFKTIRLAKQNAVRDYLFAQKVIFKSIDKIIDNGECGKERPDFLSECGTHNLVLEIDENQHSGRPCECEQTRMINISQSNGIKTIFLRYNPDKYKVQKGLSMETTNKRLQILLEWVKYWQHNEPEEFCSVQYLFFDNYVYTDKKVEVLLKNE